jgi:hypothetical protein
MGDAPPGCTRVGKLTCRTYLQKPLVELARENPDVEVVVRKQKRGTAAVIRGHYGECA